MVFPWFSHDLPDVPIQNNCKVNGLELYKHIYQTFQTKVQWGLSHDLSIAKKKVDPMDPSKTQSPRRPSAAHCG